MSISYCGKMGNTDKNHRQRYSSRCPSTWAAPLLWATQTYIRNKNSKYFPPDNGIKSNFSRIHLHRNILRLIGLFVCLYDSTYAMVCFRKLLFYENHFSQQCYHQFNSVTAFQVTNVSMLLRLLPSVTILNQDTVADMTAKTVQRAP